MLPSPALAGGGPAKSARVERGARKGSAEGECDGIVALCPWAADWAFEGAGTGNGVLWKLDGS